MPERPQRTLPEREDPRMPAARIRRIRALMGMTQEQFAQEMGTSPGTTNNWEAKRNIPGGTAIRLLERLEEDAIAERLRSTDVWIERLRQQQQELESGTVPDVLLEIREVSVGGRG